MPRLKHPYERTRVALELDQANIVDQDARYNTNLNTIMAEHEAGIPPRVTSREPLYGDASAHTTLQDSLNLAIAVNDHFDSLPAKIRQAADNNAVTFWEMMGTEEGCSHLQDLGLEIGDEDPEPQASPPPEPTQAPEPPAQAAPVEDGE